MEFLKLSRVKFANILLLCLLVNACSLTAPFVDRQRDASAKDLEHLYKGESKPEAPAICYNKLTTSFEELQKMADAECKKQKTGTYAVQFKETMFTCKLLLPNHLYFKCAGAVPKTEENEMPERDEAFENF